MSENYETCFLCGENTGRAGAGEDSIYIGDFGPFDEKCYELVLPILSAQLATIAKAVEEVQRWAIESGGFGHSGYRVNPYPLGEYVKISEVLQAIEEAGK